MGARNAASMAQDAAKAGAPTNPAGGAGPRRGAIHDPSEDGVRVFDKVAGRDGIQARDFEIAAAVWLADPGRALRVSHGLEAGYGQANWNVSYGGFEAPGPVKEGTREAMQAQSTREKTAVIDLR